MIASLHYRPARRKVNASAFEETLAQGLHLAYQLPGVHVAGGMVFDDDATIHNDCMHTATISIVDQRVDRIEKRSPLRTAGIKQDQIGFFADVNRANVMLQPQGAGPV